MIAPRTLRNLRREFSRSALAKLGVAIMAVIVFVAVFAPFLAPHDPRTQHLALKNLPPLGFTTSSTQTTTQVVNGSVTLVHENVTVAANASYPLGTDSLGHGMLSRVIYGTRTSLVVGVLGVVVAGAVGITVGLAAGYYGGNVDDALMRAADVMLAFPSLVLAIALVGMFGRASYTVPDPWVALGFVSHRPAGFVVPGTIVAVVGLVNWVWFARVARGEALGLVDEAYVTAARAAGASDRRIVARHVLPNAATPIIVLGTIQIAAIILLESSLSFLGFSGTTLSWGFDISRGRQYLATAWWIATEPGIAILLSVVSINLIGDWLRDALDPGIGGEGGV